VACRYSPINWGDFRLGRFRGDFADVGAEVKRERDRERETETETETERERQRQRERTEGPPAPAPGPLRCACHESASLNCARSLLQVQISDFKI
jgi:hypothetical protein